MAERYREREKRSDRRAGGVIAMLYNINRDPEKDPRGLDWQDFFPEWRQEQGEQTEEEMIEVMRALMAATNQEGLSH